ncbi:MAG: hypothetical protein H5T43_09105 [Methanomethylovorans sp.]|nr:hypothetical protein [Methanomethylovorans sp.]
MKVSCYHSCRVGSSRKVGKLDELKGEVIYSYVILSSGVVDATEKPRKN